MNIRTYFSILQCVVSPEDMVIACKAAGYDKLILCDNNLSGVVQFYEACNKVDKEGEKSTGHPHKVKPIFALNIKVCELEASEKGEHNKMYDLIMIAKNKVGYKSLLKILSKANNIENILDSKYQRIARVNLEEIKGMTDGLICLQGVRGTELYEVGEDKSVCEYTLNKYKEVFAEVIDQKTTPILWTDIRYLDSQYKEDFLVLLCILLKTTLKKLRQVLTADLPELLYLCDSDNYLPSKAELYDETKYPEMVSRTNQLLDSIEEYDILSKPKVPKFDCPDGVSQAEYLTELCRLGWKRKYPVWDNEELKKVYAERVKYELSVLQSCELDGYLLVVQDYVNWAKRKGWLLGPARGSAGGCLVAHLLDIIDLDPILHNLLFERFYSADRSAGGIPSLPDIDTDFPKYKREEVIAYIEEKYGLDRVCHIATYGTLKGAGAATEVLRVHDVFEQKKIKSLTKFIPGQDKISDKMEEQKEDSVLLYTLKNMPDVLKELGRWEDGKIVGEYSYYLEQAIRLEGCIRGYGVHASGILISDVPTDEIAPMIIKTNDSTKICALEMGPAEKSGLVKVDILGVEALDVLMEIKALLGGYSEDQ